MTPQEQFSDVAKVTPSITITGLTVVGIPISEWLILLTAIYTMLQIISLIRRWIISRRSSDSTCTADCPARQK